MGCPLGSPGHPIGEKRGHNTILVRVDQLGCGATRLEHLFTYVCYCSPQPSGLFASADSGLVISVTKTYSLWDAMAYLEAPVPVSSAFSLNYTIRARVEFALSRMRDPAIPRQLAAFTFLRLITHSMQALHRQGSDLMIASAIAPTYLSLAWDLTGHDPEWWKRCYLQENGFLYTEDPLIACSLFPLNDFVGRLRSESPHTASLISGSGLNR